MDKGYVVVNLANGLITLVVAKSLIEATKKGQKYFTEPNRPIARVQVLN